MVKWSAETSYQRWEASLAKMPQAVQQAMKDSIDKTARETAQRIAKTVPRGDKAPHIADSIEVNDGDRRLFEKIVSIGSAALKYAIPLEFGHRLKGRHIPPARFFFPVVIIMRKRHRSRVKRAVRKALKAVFA